MTPNIGITFAVSQEAAPFLRRLHRRRRFRIDEVTFIHGLLPSSGPGNGEPAGCVVFLTGMGRLNAERAARVFFENFSPRALVMAGFAGGIDPVLHSGDILLAENVSDPDFFAHAGERLAGETDRLPIFVGFLQTVEAPVTTPREKQSLGRGTSVSAVDMETAGVVRLAQSANCPLLGIRAVSDAADEALPVDFGRMLDARHNLNRKRLLVHLLRHPSCIPGLLRLGLKSARAARRLARALVLVAR